MLFWQELALLSPSLFADVDNVVLENEEVGLGLARQAQHSLIVVLDPAFDDFAIHQLEPNVFLFFPKSL